MPRATRNVLVLSPGRDGDAISAALVGDGWMVVREAPDPNDLAAVVVHAFADGARDALARALASGCPAVLASAPGPDVARPGPGESETDCLDHVRGWTADAYIWRDDRVAEAVRFVATEDRPARGRGPLRLVFLGIAGADPSRSWTRPPVGATFGLPSDRALLIGRVTQRVDVKFQTSVAPLHARVERTHGGAEVVDLRSTNGTWIHGERRERFAIHPGDEIGVAELLRLRLDGSP